MRPTLADRRLLSLSWCNKVLRDACDTEREGEKTEIEQEGERGQPTRVDCENAKKSGGLQDKLEEMVSSGRSGARAVRVGHFGRLAYFLSNALEGGGRGGGCRVSRVSSLNHPT